MKIEFNKKTIENYNLTINNDFDLLSLILDEQMKLYFLNELKKQNLCLDYTEKELKELILVNLNFNSQECKISLQLKKEVN